MPQGSRLLSERSEKDWIYRLETKPLNQEGHSTPAQPTPAGGVVPPPSPATRILSTGLLQRSQVIELQPQGGGWPFNVVPECIEDVFRGHGAHQGLVEVYQWPVNAHFWDSNHTRNPMSTPHHSARGRRSQPVRPLGGLWGQCLFVSRSWE